MPSAFETARLAASLLDGVVEGAALTPVSTDIVAADSGSAVPSPSRDRNKAEYIRRLRQSFDNYAKQHSTEPAVQPTSVGVTARWSRMPRWVGSLASTT